MDKKNRVSGDKASEQSVTTPEIGYLYTCSELLAPRGPFPPLVSSLSLYLPECIGGALLITSRWSINIYIHGELTTFGHPLYCFHPFIAPSTVISSEDPPTHSHLSPLAIAAFTIFNSIDLRLEPTPSIYCRIYTWKQSEQAKETTKCCKHAQVGKNFWKLHCSLSLRHFNVLSKW